MDLRRVIAALLVFASVALAIAGLVIWREMSPSIADLARQRRFLTTPPPRRLHPLRAELLWGAAAIAGLVAVGLALAPDARHSDAVGASG